MGPCYFLAYFVMILSDISPIDGGCLDSTCFCFWPSLKFFIETLMIEIILFGADLVGSIAFRGEIPLDSLLSPQLKIRMQLVVSY